jgi:peptidylprolyl isomerase
MTIRDAATTLALLSTFALAATPAVAADPAPAQSADGAKPELVTTASGLTYEDIALGQGNLPTKGQTVSVRYEISTGEKRVESSPPSQPFRFVLGKDQAMKAIEEGVSTMKVGGKRKLRVPPDLAYGTEGVPGKVPPNAGLTIDLELLAIE